MVVDKSVNSQGAKG